LVTTEEEVRVIGWTVDIAPCTTHGGNGVGFNFFVEFPGGVIQRFWWCSSSESLTQWLDSGPAK
jgi:hypothetical protein